MKQRALKPWSVMALVALSCGLAPGFVVPAHAQDKGVVHTDMVNAVRGWTGMGIRLKRGLSIVTEGLSVTVFGVGMDNQLMSINSADGTQTWGPAIDHGGNLASAPACIADLTTKSEGIRCFYVSGGVLLSQLIPQYGGERPASPVGDRKFGFAPAVALSDLQGPQKHKDNKPNYRVFGHATDDDGLWYADTASGQLQVTWVSMAGKLKGSPSCLRTEGATTCYVIGSDDAVWSVRYDHDHYAWNLVGGHAVLGVHAWIERKWPVLAVRGADSSLWVGRQDLDTLQWQWSERPGEIASTPACTATRCFAILPGGELGYQDL
ncbi:MAG TPA: hypothetical protein VK753_00665 [Xanthomonadaceae bacterium]|jgi:hypothetical protein|nr:hypothetical protein [Xanthomonadaceae bacterium]